MKIILISVGKNLRPESFRERLKKISENHSNQWQKKICESAVNKSAKITIISGRENLRIYGKKNQWCFLNDLIAIKSAIKINSPPTTNGAPAN